MKNNREMLKEAIAEARTVKETAIAQAKIALEETITPQLKSMLAKRLEEMEMEDMEEEEAMEGIEMNRKMKSEMEETMDSEMSEGDEMDEEMDLEELLAELESEMYSEELTESEDLINDPKKPTSHGNIEEEEGEEGEEGEEAEGEEEEIDLEEMSEEDLKSFIEDVIKDMVEAGELEAGEDLEIDGEEAMDGEMETEEEPEEIMEGEEEMDEAMELGLTDPEFIASMLGGIALVGGVAAASAKKELAAAAKKGKEAVANTLKKLIGGGNEAELEEMTGEVEELKNEINEVNLLNAKLLYLNKIFRAKTLTESQKVKTISAFDKAATVKEAKLIFETISEGLTTPKNKIKENLSRASKPMGVSSKKEVIMEVDSQVARWQKLAGIK